MMLKKLVLIPALLVSAVAFAENNCPATCNEVCPETKAVTETCSGCPAACDSVSSEACKSVCEQAMTSDIKKAFCLDALLKDEAAKCLYEALDKDQQARFEVMMKDLSCIVQEAAEKTEALMEKNKDIQQVWRAMGNGKTRLVLTAGFESCPETN